MMRERLRHADLHSWYQQENAEFFGAQDVKRRPTGGLLFHLSPKSIGLLRISPDRLLN
jgi:hypothetical protein